MAIERDYLLIVCAMDSEARHFRAMLEDVEEVPVARWRRSRGRLGDLTVDLILSGIGLAYAAAATTAALIDRRPSAVFNFGCAGAHRVDIRAGDVVVGSSVAHLASYVHQPDGAKHLFGFRSGEDAENERTVHQLPTDRMLVECARQAAEEADLPGWPGTLGVPTIHFGPVGSADIWTQHVETIQQHYETHGTLCEDMEAAAIAQVSGLFGVPFLTLKDISNNELQKATEFDAADSGSQLLGEVEDQIGLRAAVLLRDTLLYFARRAD